ncbi:pilus (MSHA type) biogenesis protein MshL [Shewanella mesophila]|uniref:pilus (MSHA type) biogenesis protein MshL n=1 Tax=Shewanella mesophila TaxID=2864208 RepID=UPI001C657FAF|nr:pilus (MSHA type) biogenesis protein MshL [Shewanella mesophila]QYJ86502.1 pilus (MSHA type) biogenesis protein MshL [Shewanella mesophila]
MTAIKTITPLLVLLLVACQTTDRPQPVESKSTLSHSIASETAKQVPPPAAVMPDSVQRELSANTLLSGVSPVMPTERRFDVAANDVDARVFFPSLIQGTPLSVAVHPDVTGSISLSLKGVTLSEALQVVEDIYGYEVSRDGRILRVFPAGMRTETFPLNYLYMERQGLSLTSVNSGRISDSNNSNSSNNSNNNDNNNSNSSNSNNNSSNGSSNSGSNETTNGTFIRSTTKTDFWGELKETLISIVGETGGGRQVVVTPQAGLVTVRAYPNELRQVKTFLQTAESHLQRQVILEAKILEVTLSDGYQQGIQWDKVLGSALTDGNTKVNFGTSEGSFGDQITAVLGGITSLEITNDTDFRGVITLLDTQGDVDVLSSPRVTASNNQKAVIKVGRDEYFVTDVSSTTVAGTTPVTSPEVELTPFFSGIALDVTPQIDEEGNVLLHIHPSVIDIKEQNKSIKISESTLELPLAQSEIRESDTVIKAKTGDVVVIGGLMKSENVELVSKVPLLGDIPFLGEAFTNRANSLKKTELVILLKPTVVGADTWKTELERSKALLDRWYPEDQKE